MKNTNTRTNPAREALINDRLAQIHRRLADIAAIEAKAARVGGYGSKGEFDPERQRLTEETDCLLDELTAISSTLPFGLPS